MRKQRRGDPVPPRGAAGRVSGRHDARRRSSISRTCRTREILITECTFFDADHRTKAKAGKHLHVEHFVEMLPKLKNEHIVIDARFAPHRACASAAAARERIGDEQMKRIHFLMDFEGWRGRGGNRGSGPPPPDTAEQRARTARSAPTARARRSGSAPAPIARANRETRGKSSAGPASPARMHPASSAARDAKSSRLVTARHDETDRDEHDRPGHDVACTRIQIDVATREHRADQQPRENQLFCPGPALGI